MSQARTNIGRRSSNLALRIYITAQLFRKSNCRILTLKYIEFLQVNIDVNAIHSDYVPHLHGNSENTSLAITYVEIRISTSFGKMYKYVEYACFQRKLV